MYTYRQTDAHYTSIGIKIYLKKKINICKPAGTNKIAIIAPNFFKVRFNMVYMY